MASEDTPQQMRGGLSKIVPYSNLGSAYGDEHAAHVSSRTHNTLVLTRACESMDTLEVPEGSEIAALSRPKRSRTGCLTCRTRRRKCKCHVLLCQVITNVTFEGDEEKAQQEAPSPGRECKFWWWWCEGERGPQWFEVALYGGCSGESGARGEKTC